MHKAKLNDYTDVVVILTSEDLVEEQKALVSVIFFVLLFIKNVLLATTAFWLVTEAAPARVVEKLFLFRVRGVGSPKTGKLCVNSISNELETNADGST